MLKFGLATLTSGRNVRVQLRHIFRCISSSSYGEENDNRSSLSKSALFSTFVARKSKEGGEKLSESALDSSYFEVDTKKIHYVTTGRGNHVLLVLPGALGAAAIDFKPQLDHLSKDLFTILGWDPPGYGLSQPRERDFSGDFLRRDAHIASRLMEGLGYPKYSLLGWSDGGISALMLASMFPERVNKLVVFGTQAYVTKEETEFYKKIQDISNWSEAMRKPFIELYGEKHFQALWTKWIESFNGKYLLENEGDILKSDLPNIRCPTLVVHGQKDPMVFPFHADYLKENIKGARLKVFNEGKHNLHLRYYQEFNDLVEAFLLEC